MLTLSVRELLDLFQFVYRLIDLSQCGDYRPKNLIVTSYCHRSCDSLNLQPDIRC
jgi:hypothetical protein